MCYKKCFHLGYLIWWYLSWPSEIAILQFSLILDINLTASRLHGILQQDVLSDIEKVPWFLVSSGHQQSWSEIQSIAFRKFWHITVEIYFLRYHTVYNPPPAGPLLQFTDSPIVLLLPQALPYTWALGDDGLSAKVLCRNRPNRAANPLPNIESEKTRQAYYHSFGASRLTRPCSLWQITHRWSTGKTSADRHSLPSPSVPAPTRRPWTNVAMAARGLQRESHTSVVTTTRYKLVVPKFLHCSHLELHNTKLYIAF